MTRSASYPNRRFLVGGAFLAAALCLATACVAEIHNKAAIKQEFNRRRVPLPLTLAPGKTRSGSFFFPMVPNPQALTARWTSVAGDGETTLELHFLQGLHVTSEIN
jgi:hypothetical protein